MKRTRGSSDLGNEDPRSSYTPPNSLTLARMGQSSSPSTSSLPTSILLGKQINAPYREYLNQVSGFGLPPTPPVLASRMQGMNEAVDMDTSMRYASQMYSYRVPESQFTPTTGEMMAMAMGDRNANESFLFDHASNAAFIYDGSTVGVSRASSSIRTNSPLSNDRDLPNLIEAVPVSEKARVELAKPTEPEEVKPSENVENTENVGKDGERTEMKALLVRRNLLINKFWKWSLKPRIVNHQMSSLLFSAADLRSWSQKAAAVGVSRPRERDREDAKSKFDGPKHKESRHEKAEAIKMRIREWDRVCFQLLNWKRKGSQTRTKFELENACFFSAFTA